MLGGASCWTTLNLIRITSGLAAVRTCASSHHRLVYLITLSLSGVMPLIVMCGYPSSGKTRRAEELKVCFERNTDRKVHVVGDGALGVERNTVYAGKCRLTWATATSSGGVGGFLRIKCCISVLLGSPLTCERHTNQFTLSSSFHHSISRPWVWAFNGIDWSVVCKLPHCPRRWRLFRTQLIWVLRLVCKIRQQGNEVVLIVKLWVTRHEQTWKSATSTFCY